jgi:NADH:ubiquinone oxidoreductase subunit H
MYVYKTSFDNSTSVLNWFSLFYKFLFDIEFLNLKYTSISALVISIKFLVLIALLIFIRGGIPRYRYDFLTKIG